MRPRIKDANNLNVEINKIINHAKTLQITEKDYSSHNTKLFIQLTSLLILHFLFSFIVIYISWIAIIPIIILHGWILYYYLIINNFIIIQFILKLNYFQLIQNNVFRALSSKFKL